MALDPLELGTIAAIVLVFFLWGPQKIPELARVIGQARSQFDNATKEFQKVSTSIQNGTSPFLQPSKQLVAAAASITQPTQPAVKSALPPQQVQQFPVAKTGDQLLIEAARRLGISTTGKTREQIQQEIIAMAQRAPVQDAKDAPDAPKTADSSA